MSTHLTPTAPKRAWGSFGVRKLRTYMVRRLGGAMGTREGVSMWVKSTQCGDGCAMLLRCDASATYLGDAEVAVAVPARDLSESTCEVAVHIRHGCKRL